MKVGIYDLKDPNGRDVPEQRAYEAILAHNGIASERLRVEQPDFWDRVRQLSLFIMRVKQYDSDLQLARDILPVVEGHLGVPCLPNAATGWHYDDKVKQYFLLKARGFPFTDSWVFYDRPAALDWAARTQYPVVFKLRGGAGSTNVVLVKDARQACRLIRQAFGPGIHPHRLLFADALRVQHFDLYAELHHLAGNVYRWSRGLDTSPHWASHKNYVLFQKYLPNNEWDTRVTVIGERAFAFRRMVRPGDFRASGSGRLDYTESKIDLRCVELGLRISKAMGFQSMAYDFLINPQGEPEFCEVSYTYLSHAVHACRGYWDAGLNWHEGHYWPEHLQLCDALGMELRAPEE